MSASSARARHTVSNTKPMSATLKSPAVLTELVHIVDGRDGFAELSGFDVLQFQPAQQWRNRQALREHGKSNHPKCQCDDTIVLR
jgi:hypothetical protein